MQLLIESISNLYKEWTGAEPMKVDVLPISGSERRYFRLHGANGSVIGTYGANVKENESFIYFSREFSAKKLSVPEIFAVSKDRMFYLQEDLEMCLCLIDSRQKDFPREYMIYFARVCTS